MDDSLDLQKIIKKLEISSDATLVDYAQSHIRFSLLNSVDFYILNAEASSVYKKDLILNDKTIIFLDKEFTNLNLFLNKNPSKRDAYWLNKLLNFIQLTPENNLEEKYKLLPTYNLKKEFIKKHKINRNPDNEFFFFSSDEMVSRYKKINGEKIRNPKINEEGIKVKIPDSSAIVFTSSKTGKRNIDCHIYGYIKDNKVYYQKDITEKIKTNKDDPDRCTIHSSTDGTQTYYKEVLKKGVDLSKLDHDLVEHYEGKEVLLKYDETNLYHLEDEKGIIYIRHPDLLVELENNIDIS